MTKNTPISDIWVHVRVIFGVLRVSMDATSPMQRLEGLFPQNSTKICIQVRPHIFPLW